MPIIDVAGQEQLVGQELRPGKIYEIEQVRREVRRVARLASVVEHAHGRGAVAIEAGVGIGVAQIDIGLVVLPADLAEALIDAGRGVIAPTGLVKVIAGQKIIEVAELTAGSPFERAPSERSAVRLEFGARIIVSAFGLD